MMDFFDLAILVYQIGSRRSMHRHHHHHHGDERFNILFYIKSTISPAQTGYFISPTMKTFLNDCTCASVFTGVIALKLDDEPMFVCFVFQY